MPYEKKSYKKFSGKGKTTLNPSSLTLNALRYDHKDLCDVAPAGSTKDFESRGGYRRSQPKNRGRLAPLMTEEAKATASIHELSYDFGCRITRLFQYLTEDAEYKEYVADFLSKMSIAYKEADETDFWLNLLHDNGYLNDEQFNSLNKDIDRILKVLASIVKTMKEKIEAGKKK